MKETILVIDDEESIRYAFTQHLKREGFEVTTGFDYNSAISALSEVEPDLVITDIVLEGKTGIDILHDIKSRKLNCPVVVITGEPNVDTAAEAVRKGAFDYIAKPVHKKTLLKIVKTAITHKRLIDEKLRLEAEKDKYRSNLEAIFRSLDDAVISIDNKQNISGANDSLMSICGVNPETIMSRTLAQKEGDCSLQCHSYLTKALQSKDIIKDVRIECRRKSRLEQVVVTTSSPLKKSSGEAFGAMMVIRDVTRITELEKELGEKQVFQNIIGRSPEMAKVFSLIKNLASADTTVLITGESGTGKELVARALHNESDRSKHPFVAVNCSALPENLLESELFGHVKGAFTGAMKDKKGRFESADKGTLFLDEIGDISPIAQVKLLRVLQERQFERVGDSKTMEANVRIIAATNAKLKDLVDLGSFRADLYYRLKVVEISIPALRTRREDIPLLAHHFCRKVSRRINRETAPLSEQAINLLIDYPWPGNARELEHAIEHATIMCENGMIMPRHMPMEIQQFSSHQDNSATGLAGDDKSKVLQALEYAGWNKAKAARLLGLSRQGIYRKIARYQIKQPTE